MNFIRNLRMFAWTALGFPLHAEILERKENSRKWIYPLFTYFKVHRGRMKVVSTWSNKQDLFFFFFDDFWKLKIPLYSVWFLQWIFYSKTQKTAHWLFQSYSQSVTWSHSPITPRTMAFVSSGGHHRSPDNIFTSLAAQRINQQPWVSLGIKM